MSFFIPNWEGALSRPSPDDPGGRPSPPETAISGDIDYASGADRPPLSLPCGIPRRGFRLTAEIPQGEP